MKVARSLGLDIGDRRIGVALSDPQGILASPLTIITRRSEAEDVQALTDIIDRHGVTMVIAGLPRSMDGRVGEQAKKVQAFIRRLSAQTDVPLEFRDERLTTVMVGRLRRRAKTKRGRRNGNDDAEAAALILQGYLEEKLPG